MIGYYPIFSFLVSCARSSKIGVHRFPKILHKKLKAEIVKCDMIGYFKDNSQSYSAITASVLFSDARSSEIGVLTLYNFRFLISCARSSKIGVPVVTCFSMFTHVHVTFIAFPSFCGAVHSVCDRILVFHVQFLWKYFIMIT